MTTFGPYTEQDHADQMREDAREERQAWCGVCQRRAHKANWCRVCRQHTCEDCEDYTLPWGFDCVVCWRAYVREERNVWVREKGTQHSYHAGACGFALCMETKAHEHVVGPQTVVVERMAA